MKNGFHQSITEYAVKLEGVANQLARDISASVSASDKKTLMEILKSVQSLSNTSDPKAVFSKLKALEAKISTIRSRAIKEAEKKVRETAIDVAESTTGHEKSLLRLIDKELNLKPLPKKKVKEIIDYSPFMGQTVGQWFDNYKKQDLTRIISAVAKAANENLTVDGIRKLIMGTKAAGYTDGVFQTTRQSATMMARTLINGVANQTRMELFAANDDVIDGVQFVATLDGRTSFLCASFDGTIWRNNQKDQIRRPPLHPSCRSTLVPYIEIKDENGNIIETGTRPAANADFDKEAQDAYNKTAREKGWTRRWEDLSASTRKKYYYAAQKDYTARTGKSPYRQVSSSENFRDYFEKQPEKFKRSWLGETRYRLYSEGKLKLESIVKADTDYTVPVAELKKKYGDDAG